MRIEKNRNTINGAKGGSTSITTIKFAAGKEKPIIVSNNGPAGLFLFSKKRAVSKRERTVTAVTRMLKTR
jgi:hypothetical protein